MDAPVPSASDTAHGGEPGSQPTGPLEDAAGTHADATPEVTINATPEPTINAMINAIPRDTPMDIIDATADALDSAASMATRSVVAPAYSLTHMTASACEAPPAHPEVVTGTRIDHYVVLEKRGSGGMGTVYKVYDSELNRMVALKLLSLGRRDSERGRVRMTREAQALARLSHPNVVPVYSVGSFHDTVYLVMELVEGQTLETWLGQGERSIRDILEVFIAAGRGLDAAHRAGLVHRDFKPCNVLVGDDGRVRILDFGLARAAVDHSRDRSSDSITRSELLSGIDSVSDSMRERPMDLPRDVLESPITRTGLLVGTPKYMAPEQYRHANVDAKADQFSYCVALYEAIYGSIPFAGNTVSELKANVLAGNLLTPSGKTRVPRRLQRTIVRGLSVVPDERFPSMSQILAELQQKSAWARIKPVAATIMLTVAAIAAVTAAVMLWRTHRGNEEQRRRETMAAARLVAVEEHIGALLGNGATPEAMAAADDAFFAFTRLDEHRGTRALAEAWFARASRMRSSHDWQGEVSAYASAYAARAAPEQQQAALAGLARVFYERHDMSALGRVLDTLSMRIGSDRGGRELIDIRPMRTLMAQDRRDSRQLLEEVAAGTMDADLEPLIRRLGRATELPYPSGLVEIDDIDRDGRDDMIIYQTDDASLIAARSDGSLIWRRTLPSDRSAPLSIMPLQLGDLHYLLVHQQQPSKPNEAVLYRLRGAELEAVHRWDERSLLSAVTADLDADGDSELYMGTGPYTRTLRVLRLTSPGSGDGRVSVSEEPAIARARSDVNWLDSADLDGDGRPELIAALGPWRAYDLRILRYSHERGGLELVDHRKLGAVGPGHVLRDALTGEQRVAVLKLDAYPNVREFPADKPFGEPAGIYIFALRRGKLVEVEHIPLFIPREVDSSAVVLRGFVAGDFDGDGHTDLALALEPHATFSGAMIYRQRPEGGFSRLYLGGVELLGSGNLDDDAADELVVALAGQAQIWVMGKGGGELPMREVLRPTEAPRAVPAAALASPAFAGQWKRAEELVAMGLSTQAAEVFADLATVTAEMPLSAHALHRAAELWQASGDTERAATYYDRAVAAGAALPEALIQSALRAAATGYIELTRYGDAIRALRGLLERSDLAEDIGRQARIELAWLGPMVDGQASTTITFDQPLSPSWRIEEPLAMRRDWRSGVLRVDAFASHGILATLPIEQTSERLSLTVELEVDRTEWGSHLGIRLQPAGQSEGPSISVFTSAGGGGGINQRHLGCSRLSPSPHVELVSKWPMPEPGIHGTATITAELLPTPGYLVCKIELDGESGRIDKYPVVMAVPRGAYELVISGSSGQALDQPFMLSARIRRITIGGARLGHTSVPAPPLAQANRLLSDGDPDAALQVYSELEQRWAIGRTQGGDGGEGSARIMSELGRAVALSDAGRSAEAARSLSAAVARSRADPELAAALDEQLVYLLRIGHGNYEGTARAALGRGYIAHYMAAWMPILSMHPTDERAVASLTTELDLRDEAALGDDAVLGRIMLLEVRGRAWWQRGRYAPARQALEQALALGYGFLDAHQGADAQAVLLPVRELLASANRSLAAIEASVGHTDMAFHYARQSLDIAESRPTARDRLLVLPELEAMSNTPRWQLLLDER